MKTKNLIYLTLTLILTLLWGCEEEYDNVIDNNTSNFQVTSVAPSDSLTFNQLDSLITIKINFNSSSILKDVFCDIYSSANIKLNAQSISLFDNGNPENGDAAANDNQFSNRFPLSQFYPNGIYDIKYFVTDASNKTKEVAWGTFRYNNGQNNIAPVLSDEIVEPDTAVVTSTTVILTSIKASDQNGLSDIEKVFFIVYRPDGTTNNNQNVMFDDGKLTDHGDQTAGDGIYSLLIQITSSNAKGTYRLEFRAQDRGGKLSNIINHSLLIQ
jgi:hypothetical protein